MQTQHPHPFRRSATRAARVTSAALVLAAAAAAPAYADGDKPTGRPADTGKPVGHNPTGNNGTVFIHDVAGDQTPHNVPHVSCQFWVDLFGFDAGQELSIGFDGQAPTGKGVPLGGTWSGVASDDDAGGAGNDFDLELAFTAEQLGVTALGDPHPKQGYHVKMSVDTGEPGGHKYKVFWIEPCDTDTSEETGTDQPPAPDTTGGETSGGIVEGGHPDRATPPTVLGSTSHRSQRASAATPAEVLGERVNRSPRPATGHRLGALPFTGAPVDTLLALSLGTLAAGAALTAAGRRRRVMLD